MKNFKSDNIAPVNHEIIQAIIDANKGTQNSYGTDDYSKLLQKKISEVFEKDVIVYLTNTGTVANSLCLSSLVEPHEIIYCHQAAHINVDECGAPELYTGGAKLMPMAGVNGKLNPAALKENILFSLSSRPHGQKPGCVSITQATECGTVYTIEELNAITQIAKEYDLPVHMDGARFANSLVKLNCKPAENSWLAGVDVLSFGATKNGAICAEAIIFFNHKYAADFDYMHKRAGQLVSKSRFFACQFLAYLDNDLWIKNAVHANTIMQKLVQVFQKHDVKIIYPVESNELFVQLKPNVVDYLKQDGYGFYEWGTPGIGIYRFVTSFFTSEAAIESLDVALSHD